MMPKKGPESPFEGLLICGDCGGAMTFLEGGVDEGPRYACRAGAEGGRSRCPCPYLDAAAVDALVIGTVLQAILTGRNTATVLSSANEPRPGNAPPARELTGEDLRELKDDPQLFVRAVGGVGVTRNFLGEFIAGIEIHTGRAIINYSIPLPGDGPLAGKRCLEIALPPETLA